MQPITPDEIRKKLPDQVIEAINGLLEKHWDGTRAKFTQKEAASSILDMPDFVKTGVVMGDIYANKWLDFESVYRDAGWEVVYDKPGFNESYEANFTFTRKR